MSDTVSVRSASTRDVAAIAPLVREYWAFEGIDGFDAGQVSGLLERVLRDERLGRIWVAERAGHLAGYLVAMFVFSLEQRGLIAEIDEFFVVPAARCAGTGSALLLQAEADLRRTGCVCLQLQLGRENAAARRFYRRQGYAERDGFELLDKRLQGLRPA